MSPRSALAWLAPLFAGLTLRAAGLRSQVLGDDELHAVRAAMAMPLSEILVTYRETDHSIPLSALYRLGMDAGWVFSEIGLRAPVLVASAALLMLAPLALAAILGTRFARVWAWLLALSPMLVIYSRVVRSYGVVLLLATLACACFLRWWDGMPRAPTASALTPVRTARPAAGWAVGYVLLAAAAIWFHLGAAPLVVAPWIFAALDATQAAVRGRQRKPGVSDAAASQAQPGLHAIALVGCGFGIGTAALLWPARATLLALMVEKSGVGGLTFAIGIDVLHLQSGIVSGAGAVLFGLFATFGFAWLIATRPRVACYSATLVLAQLAGLLVLAPKLDSAVVANRAFLVALPWLLLFAAAAGTASSEGLARASGRVWFGTAGLAAGGLALLACGPSADAGFRRSGFQQHNDYITFTRARPRIAPAGLPDFYRWLDADAGAAAGALVELPWHPFWGFGHAVPAYQERHGRPVRVSNREDFGRDARFAWRNFVPLRADALLASDAVWAVLHRDLESEESRARAAMVPPLFARPQPGEWAHLRALAEAARREFEDAWGPPDHRDEHILAWNLGRIREQRTAAPGAGP